MGSLSLLQEIFPTQGSNPGLPHCRQILYQLSHKGSPRTLEWVAYHSPADLPNSEIELGSPALQVDTLPTELWGKWTKRVELMLNVPIIKKRREHMKILEGVCDLGICLWPWLWRCFHESLCIDWPKCSFDFFHKMLQKNLNKLFGQLNRLKLLKLYLIYMCSSLYVSYTSIKQNRKKEGLLSNMHTHTLMIRIP